MKNFAIALMAVLSVVVVDTQERKEYRLVSAPGKLESLLLSGNVQVNRHELGSLKPPGTAKLWAVVASDSASSRVEKGLAVQLEGDDPSNNNRHRKDTVYIDEDGLRDLENRLVGAVQNEKWIRANRSKLGLVPNEDPAISFAANRGPEKNVFYVPVEFGSYWHDDRFGVYVLAPHSEHSSGPHGTTQFRMPNADVSELLLLIRKGRAWLEEDPPHVDSVAETLER